jgi:hypothetical protein
MRNVIGFRVARRLNLRPRADYRLIVAEMSLAR